MDDPVSRPGIEPPRAWLVASMKKTYLVLEDGRRVYQVRLVAGEGPMEYRALESSFAAWKPKLFLREVTQGPPRTAQEVFDIFARGQEKRG